MDFDPIELFAAQEAAAKDAEKSKKRFQTLSRKLFKSPEGREWLALAMAQFNYMGSTFSDSDKFNSRAAAYRDGARAVISEILNSAQASTTTKTNEH